jgi:hypothetical protein
MSSLSRAWEDLAAKVRAEFDLLRQGKPGHRFRVYHRAKNEEPDAVQRRTQRMIVGVVLILAGIIMCVAPGPGLLTIAAGLAVLASASRLLARALDVLEVKVWAWLRRPKA